MAIQNIIDKNTPELTVDPGSAADSFLQFAINSSNKFRIGADNTDDSYRIAIGNALGTSDALTISSAGECNLPSQPAFLSYLSSTASNVTGDGTLYTVLCDTIVFDVTGNYSAATGTFTAPVAGRYMFSCNIAIVVTPTTGGDQIASVLKTTSDTFYLSYFPTRNRCANFYGPNNAISTAGGVLTDMDAGDTAFLQASSGVGAKVDSVYGGANCYTWLAGYLAV